MLVNSLDSDQTIDLAHADYCWINEEGVLEKEHVEVDVNELYKRNSVGPCFLYRRKVQELLNGYREEYFLAEDYDFWLRAFTSFDFTRIKKVLYQYRNHEGSLTSTRRDDIWQVKHRVMIDDIAVINKFTSKGKIHFIRSITKWCIAYSQLKTYPRFQLMLIRLSFVEGLKVLFSGLNIIKFLLGYFIGNK